MLLDAQFWRRTRPLVIAGPEEIETRLTHAMEAMFEHSSRTRQRFELSVCRSRRKKPAAFGNVSITPYPVVHGNSGGPFLAYRLEAEGRVLAYTADTEWTETLIPAAAAPICSSPRPTTYDKIVKNHLSLKTLEAHLAEIAPKRLILTHMSDDMLWRLDKLGPTPRKTA